MEIRKGDKIMEFVLGIVEFVFWGICGVFCIVIGWLALLVIFICIGGSEYRSESMSVSCGFSTRSDCDDYRANDERLTKYTQHDGSIDYYPSSWHGPDEPGGSLDI